MDKLLIDLALQGLTVRQIAAHVGLHRVTVQRRVLELVKAGALPPVKARRDLAGSNKSPRTKARRFADIRRGNVLGCMGDVLDGLTHDQISWLSDAVPEGVSLAEFCVALIRDAYAGENDMAAPNALAAIPSPDKAP